MTKKQVHRRHVVPAKSTRSPKQHETSSRIHGPRASAFKTSSTTSFVLLLIVLAAIGAAIVGLAVTRGGQITSFIFPKENLNSTFKETETDSKLEQSSQQHEADGGPSSDPPPALKANSDTGRTTSDQDELESESGTPTKDPTVVEASQATHRVPDGVHGTKTNDQSDGGYQETFLKKLIIRNITVNGRHVIAEELVGTKKRPGQASIRVYQFENFLSGEECKGLMAAHHRHVQHHSQDPILCFDSVDTLRKHLRTAKRYNVKVSNRDFTEGTTCVNSSFSRDLKSVVGWSFSTAFYPGETKFSTIFDRRVYQATGLKPSNGGKYQITSYREGIGYKSHTDCTLGNGDLRDRMGTILVYLQDVEEGGQTEFPELGISVTPRRGRAIVWNNQNSKGVCDPYSLHVARPVIKGHKIILQRWYYYKSFYMLGKRPDEPHLPPREALQPLVSCDEYDHGSCRWYDEWNYSHLKEYRQAMTQLQ